jgi:hypothetical protein
MTKDEALILLDVTHEKLEGLVHLDISIKVLRDMSEKLEEFKSSTYEGVRRFVQNDYIAFLEHSIKGSLDLQEELKRHLSRYEEKAESLND